MARSTSTNQQLPRGPGQRSVSFHGRRAERRHQLAKQRPKTQPDLLAGVRGRSFRAADGGEPLAVRRTPSMVLVNVTVLRSLWSLNVTASAEWSVADLVAATVGIYVKKGRRPLLPSTDPSGKGAPDMDAMPCADLVALLWYHALPGYNPRSSLNLVKASARPFRTLASTVDHLLMPMELFARAPRRPPRRLPRLRRPPRTRL